MPEYIAVLLHAVGILLGYGRHLLGTVKHCATAPTWDWLHLKRDAIRQILGFFIGEEPVDPFARSSAPGVPAAALAIGPP